MYVAMNRFPIAEGREAEFEEVWRRRDSYLDEVEGFQRFHLLRGEPHDGRTIFISRSEWVDQDAFVAWTKSEAFTKAHRQARSPDGVVLGHPQFEGYEVVDL